MTTLNLTADDIRDQFANLTEGGKLEAAIAQAVTAANEKAAELGALDPQAAPTPAPVQAPEAAVGAAARAQLADLVMQRAAETQPGERSSDPAADPADAWDDDAPTVEAPRLSILAEAAAIVDGDRETDYGPAERNLARIAGMWSAYLEVEVTVRDVAWMMVQLKSSRDRHRPKRDNLVDGAGYLALIEQTERR